MSCRQCLCSVLLLADKVRINPKEETLVILHDEEFNSKTIRDHIPNVDAFRAVSGDLVKKCKECTCSIVIM